MRKRLLSAVFACLLLPFSATAQFYPTPSVSPEDGQIWWCNYDQDAVLYYFGTSIAEHYDMATFIPSGLLGSDNLNVCGFSFYPISTSADNVKVWVSKTLPEWGADADLETVSVASADLVMERFNDVKFQGVHKVPAEGLYVGLSFDITSFSDPFARYPVLSTNTENNREKACFLRTTSAPTWKEREGNAAFKLLFSGDFVKNAASVADFSADFVAKGESILIPVNVRSQGVEPIKSLSFTVTTGSVTSDEVTIAADLDRYGRTRVVSVPFAADVENKEFQKVLTITKVNGQPNEYAANSAKGSLITVDARRPLTTVVEGYTGTWSSYAPAGIVGIGEAKKKFGDKVAFISVHTSNGSLTDPMETKDYELMVDNITEIPTSHVNRMYVVYPSALRLIDNLERTTERFTPASLTLKAQWYTDNQIVFDAAATFGYDADNADYGIAYVLTEDGMSGTGSEWAQKNGYSGDSGSEVMQYWYDAPSSVTGMQYDDVAVAAWDIAKGADGSVPQKVSQGETYTHRYAVSIAKNTLIQDKQKLKAVALLIDRTSGRIVNASQTELLPADPQGIQTVAAAGEGETQRFDAAGRHIAAPQRGLNIVRKADGTTVKVMR